MIPPFALDLGHDGIRLLQRKGTEWRELGMVALDDPEIGGRLAGLVDLARALSDGPMRTELIIPPSQILYTTVDVPGSRRRLRDEDVRDALEGKTPVAPDELVFDWRRTDDTVRVAVLERRTLQEAEDFAVSNGFNPVSFTARPEPHEFPEAPDFGPTAAAAAAAAALEADLPPMGAALSEPEPEDTDTAPAMTFSSSRRGYTDKALAANVTEAVLPDGEPDVAAADEVEGLNYRYKTEIVPHEDPEPVPDAELAEDAAEDSEPVDPPEPEAADTAEDVTDDDSLPAMAEAELPADGEKEELENIFAEDDEDEVGDDESAAALDASADPEEPDTVEPETSAEPVDVLDDDEDLDDENLDPVEAEAADVLEERDAETASDADDVAGDADAEEGAEPPTEPAEGLDSSDAETPEDAEEEPEVAALAAAEPDLSDDPPLRRLSIPPAPETALASEIPEAPPVRTPSTSTVGVGGSAIPPAQRATRSSAAPIAPQQRRTRQATVVLAAMVLAVFLVLGAFALLNRSPGPVAIDAPEAPTAAPEVADDTPTGTSPEIAGIAPAQPDRPAVETAPEAPVDEVVRLDPPDAVAPRPDGDLTDEELAETGPAPAAEAEDTDLAQEGPPQETEDDAARRYAATGIWTFGPDPTTAPVADELDDLYLASIDPVIASEDAFSLTVPEATDVPISAPALPPEPGQEFDLDADGFVTATPEGAMTPDGVIVTAGPPPVVPLRRPREIAAPETDDAVGEALADLQPVRPKRRPGGLVERSERVQFGGRTRAELATLRPRQRPISDQIAAARAVGEAPTAQAVAVSRAPRSRPDNFAVIVAAAQAAARPRVPETASAPASTAPAAPQTAAAPAAPQIPTVASVARQATVENAINLRRVNLIGVYGSAGDRRALVRLPSGRYVKVQVGDRVDGGQVAAINDTQLRYVKGGRNVVLDLPGG